MAGGRTQKNKAHKTPFASKSSRNAHKLSGDKVAGKGPARVIPTGQAAREIRHQRNKNIREQKRAGVLAEKRASSSPSSAPRILALVSLSAKANVEALKNRILAVCHTGEANGTAGRNDDTMDTENAVVRESKEPGSITVSVPRFKLRLTIIEAPRDDLQACLEVAKVADIVAFVGHVVPDEGGYIDQRGRQCLSMLRSLGLPVTTGLLVGLADVAAKKKSDVKKGALAALETEFLEDTKMHIADSTDECQQVLRHLAEQRVSNPAWRAQRPFLVAHQLEYEADPKSSGTGILRVSGYVRSRGISVNQLVHLAGVGDFQLKQIDLVEDPCPLRQQKRQDVSGDSMQVEDESAGQKVSTSVAADPTVQEPLIVENIPDDLAGEQTWPTEEELAEAGKAKRRVKKKRVLPRGTSDYQAAWIVEDSDQEEGDDDDDDDAMEGVGLDAQVMDDEREGSVISEDDRATSVWDGDDSRSEMMDEEDLTPEQRKSEIERLKAAHAADEEFPDEVDTPSDIPARQRFAKYRGLKSLRTSPWDPKESLPFEYAKIFAFDSFARTQKSVLSKLKEIESGTQEGSFATGSFVRLHILQVPASKVEPLLKSYKTNPVVVCGLLQHESKMSVLHFSVKKSEGYTDPIKSKELLVFHTGFRRHHTRPIFSTDDLNMDKHKFERFLHPGRFSIASIFAPISFPTLPLIVFKESDQPEGASVVATGSLRSVDPDRVILKKIVLSGYPLRVQKRKAVVRFMFHNPEDVRWFRPLELWTKYGRRGRIKEPVGTHGSMKCVFDGVVQQRDAVCINLYKRVYPKWPQHLLTD